MSERHPVRRRQRAELGGRSVMWSERTGEDPAVLLLGGCGVGSWNWIGVADRLPGRHLLALDRPGMAGTPWPGRLPTLAAEVATLADLLRSAAAGPVVIVAHSMAGPHAEALARCHPQLVAGLVLLDGSAENRHRWPKAAAERTWLALARLVKQPAGAAAARRLAPLTDRLLSNAQSHRRGFWDPQPQRSEDAYRDPDTVAMVLAEQAAYRRQIADLARLRQTTAFPQLPVRVLTAGGNRHWIRVQAELAERLGGQHVVLEDSRHLVMIDRPGAVAAVVEAVLAIAR